jgi:hypothetical protein
LAKGIVIGAAGVTITGLAADQVADFMDSLQAFVDDWGLDIAITGATLVGIAVGLKVLSSFWKGFGRRYRAFLRGFGLRP